MVNYCAVLSESSTVLRINCLLLSYVNRERNAKNESKCVDNIILHSVSYNCAVRASVLKYVYDYRKLVIRIKFVASVWKSRIVTM
jgi:hypothetical protein